MDKLLKQQFERARVPLRFAASVREFDPWLVPSHRDAFFMMDVRRRRSRNGRPSEHILVHYGQGVEVRVLDADPERQQLILWVSEPEARMRRSAFDSRARVWVQKEYVVPRSSRRFLIGMDECHLFVCALSRNASSVAEARRKLVPDTVALARHQKTKRQGEWFFVPVEEAEVLEKIEQVVALIGTLERELVSFGARPHRVDEVVSLGQQSYARGCVRHPDHRVLKLKGWHSVHVNTEARGAAVARIAGMSWTD